ncbi:DUF58 domain-containing protein [Neptunicella sp.]|uniref:DUF58 domain-containing protein n=1 Tax=Neptunicella sp. TaxID=2125986 RepID=UPI003F6933C3
MNVIKNWYQQRLYHWLNRRIPASREFTLQQRNIFILPSRFGLIYLLLCAGLFVLGSNYQNNLMIILCYFLLSLLLIHLLSCYLNFSGMKIQIGRVMPVFCGETAQLPLWLESGQRHGNLFFAYMHQSQQQCVDLDRLTNPIQVNLNTHKRGILTPPRITISSFYPLGLFRCWTHLAIDCQLVVYPAPISCAMRLYSSSDENDEQSSTSPQQGQNDFEQLRPYQRGEPLNHIAWKQVAQGRGTYSKQFNSESSQQQWLKLLPHSQIEQETQLGQLTHMVIELTQQGQAFGLQLGAIQIAPNSGKHHQHACLEALARY